MNSDTVDRGAAAGPGIGGGACLTVPLGAEVDDAAVEAAVQRAFREQRAFTFAPCPAWQGGDAGERQRLAVAVRAEAVAAAAPDSPAARERLQRDARLMQRLGNAVRLTHDLLMANEGGSRAASAPRRVVLIRELPGAAFLFEQGEAAVLARVGQGPIGDRVPTIYLGLRLFDQVAAERDGGAAAAGQGLRLVLRLEQRAIETGYSHVEAVDARQRAALETFHRVLREPALGFVPPDQELPPPCRPVRVTAARRQAFLRRLNARRADSPLDFDAAICTAAMRSLERLAQRAKRHGDADSRRAVMRLLVAAAGHDLHEVRNHANLLLERMLAPKEFGAPLARTFANVTHGATHRFSFHLPARRGRYLLRIYRGDHHHRYPGESDIRYHELELRHPAPGAPAAAEYRFDQLGHYDYCVARVHASGRREWLKDAAASGRINVIPDLRGELALQIFVDIHGHTRAWWGDGEHPGLVYNEHGEVIRLGTFADVAAHLPRIQRRYGFTIIYLLGVQKRGSNREDWSSHATSASPFSPESLIEMEPSLGGNDGLRDVVTAAHALGMKVVVDVIPHLNRRVHDVPESFAVCCFDDAGNLVPRASTDGRYGTWNDGVLFNYRRLAVWEWLAGAVRTLVERFGVDGVRCDIAHALPVVMKRNNASTLPSGPRSDEDPGRGTLVPTDHEQVAAAIKPAPRGLWLAVCSFSADSATVSVDLRTAQAIDEAARYVVVDPTCSPVTRGYAHYTGRELRVTPLTTSVSYRQRVKLLRIDLAGEDSSASELLRDSFDRLLAARSRDQVAASFAYRALADAAASRDRLLRFLDETLLPLYDASADEAVAVGLKRALYHAHREAGVRTGTGAGLGHLHGGALPAAARAGGVLARALDLLRSRPGRVRVGGGGAVLQERRSGQRHVRTAPRAGPSRRVDVRDHAAVPQRGRTGGGQDAGRGGAVRRDLHRRDRALSAWRRGLRGRRASRRSGGGDLLPARPP